MRRLVLWAVLLILSAGSAFAAPGKDGGGSIRWRNWSVGLFEEASYKKKFVILDLEAVWCHWCHVMDEKTYGNPEVVKLVKARFIPVKVDQDSRPDLSNRYEDYGWPATIVFNSDGTEIVKRSGYIEPDQMIAMLRSIIKNPSFGPPVQAEAKIEFVSEAALSKDLRAELEKRHVDGFDSRNGGWGGSHKFLDWNSVEYSLNRAKAGDKNAAYRARLTLDQELNLLDSVWGGVYQYSTNHDWKHPHYEKIMSHQAGNLRVYSQAYALWKESRYLKAAENIHGYLTNFLLAPEGAFYTSQDADLVKGKHSSEYFELNDAQRRRKGMPRIDKHIYSRENGWAIAAIIQLYTATGNKEYLNEAIRAAKWITANRALPGGGFSHDKIDVAGPYLGDSLSMGQAFLILYAATGDRRWLEHAEDAANFISRQFSCKAESGNPVGFATADLQGKQIHKPAPVLDENIAMARFANLLYHYSGRKKYKQLSEQAMRYLATPAVATKRRTMVAGILLADSEISGQPAHITVVGGKADPMAGKLFLAAIGYPDSYKRVEWFDFREGPLPNNDVEFPQLAKAAAFACANQRCSRPSYEPDGLFEMVARLTEPGELSVENKNE